VADASDRSDDSSKSAVARERTYPILPPARPPAAQLAVACSALRFVLLQQFVAAPQAEAGGGDGPAAQPGQADGAAAAAAADNRSPGKKLALALLSTIGGGRLVPAGKEAGSGAPLAAGGQLVVGRGGGSSCPPYAGGVYGDGPIWAVCALLHVAGQQRAYQQLDVCRLLGQQLRMDELRQGGGAEGGVAGAQLRQLAVATARSEQVGHKGRWGQGSCPCATGAQGEKGGGMKFCFTPDAAG
jgi:hypothetical protein